jgi:hypothetical protein
MSAAKYSRPTKRGYRQRGRAKGPSPELLEAIDRIGGRVRPDLTGEQRSKATPIIAARLHPNAMTRLGRPDLRETRLAVSRAVKGVEESASKQSRLTR